MGRQLLGSWDWTRIETPMSSSQRKRSQQLQASTLTACDCAGWNYSESHPRTSYSYYQTSFQSSLIYQDFRLLRNLIRWRGHLSFPLAFEQLTYPVRILELYRPSSPFCHFPPSLIINLTAMRQPVLPYFFCLWLVLCYATFFLLRSRAIIPLSHTTCSMTHEIMSQDHVTWRKLHTKLPFRNFASRCYRPRWILPTEYIFSTDMRIFFDRTLRVRHLHSSYTGM